MQAGDVRQLLVRWRVCVEFRKDPKRLEEIETTEVESMP